MAILFLSEIDNGAPVGQKATRLARMMERGIPVPPGFVLPHSDPFEEEALLKATASLGAVSFAIRSSAPPDEPRRKTILGISGRTRVLEAVRQVRESGDRTSVIVQKMIPAQTAGTLYTRDPLDPAAEHLVFESGGRRWTIPREDYERDESSTLDPRHEEKLCRIGLDIETLFEGPQDIAWIVAASRVFVLRARPVSAMAAQESRRYLVQELRGQLARPQTTVWTAWDLLSAPTPMTWAILRRCEREGGVRAFEKAGYSPGTEVRERGYLELIAGRVYCNLSIEARRYFGDLPLAHDFESMRTDPALALYATPSPALKGAPIGEKLKGPWLAARRMAVDHKLGRLADTFADDLETQVLPVIEEHLRSDREQPTRLQSKPALAKRISGWIDHFATESYVWLTECSLVADWVWRQTSGSHAAIEGNASAAMVRDLVSGGGVEPYGHRADFEWEIAHPRWGEEGEALKRRLDALKGEIPVPEPALAPEAALSRRYHALLGTLHHRLMEEYARIRELLLDLAERTGIGEDIFQLEPEELEPLARDIDYSATIVRRRRERDAWLTVDLPLVIFSDGLDVIGRTDTPAGQRFQAQPVAPGFARGAARIVRDPADAPRLSGDEILVLPSSDPVFAPLYLRARGVVFERGGLFSQGAILARDFGIPAIANLPGLSRLVRPGETLTLDGTKGIVHRGSAESL